jgi:hypothetical protein
MHNEFDGILRLMPKLYLLGAILFRKSHSTNFF